MILETGFVIDFLRDRQNAIEKASELIRKDETLFVTSVTIFELWHGSGIKAGKKKDKLEKFIDSLNVLVLDQESAKKGGEIHRSLISNGMRIDPEDSMIAGIAVKHNQKLLTRDEHFSRIDGLKTKHY